MTDKVIGVITPAEPYGMTVESLVEHIGHSAIVAIDDLNAVIWTTNSKPELALLKALAEELIVKLDASAATAQTLHDQFKDMRQLQRGH